MNTLSSILDLFTYLQLELSNYWFITIRGVSMDFFFLLQDLNQFFLVFDILLVAVFLFKVCFVDQINIKQT